RRSPIGVLVRADLIGKRGELRIRSNVEIFNRKIGGGRTTEQMQRLPVRVADDQSVDLGGGRQRSTEKVGQRRLAEAKAAAANLGGDKVALIDCSIEVFAQRPLLGGELVRDKAGNVLAHNVAVGGPIDDQDRTDRDQDENADAHDERRQQ